MNTTKYIIFKGAVYRLAAEAGQTKPGASPEPTTQDAVSAVADLLGDTSLLSKFSTEQVSPGKSAAYKKATARSDFDKALKQFDRSMQDVINIVHNAKKDSWSKDLKKTHHELVVAINEMFKGLRGDVDVNTLAYHTDKLKSLAGKYSSMVGDQNDKLLVFLSKLINTATVLGKKLAKLDKKIEEKASRKGRKGKAGRWLVLFGGLLLSGLLFSQLTGNISIDLGGLGIGSRNDTNTTTIVTTSPVDKNEESGGQDTMTQRYTKVNDKVVEDTSTLTHTDTKGKNTSVTLGPIVRVD